VLVREEPRRCTRILASLRRGVLVAGDAFSWEKLSTTWA